MDKCEHNNLTIEASTRHGTFIYCKDCDVGYYTKDYLDTTLKAAQLRLNEKGIKQS